MNKTWYSMILAVGLAAGCATTDAPESTSSFEGIDLSSAREVVLTVHGLSCPLCSNNLDGQLARIEGVEETSIDLKTGAVTVQLADGHTVTPGELDGAVQNAGFSLKQVVPKGRGE